MVRVDDTCCVLVRVKVSIVVTDADRLNMDESDKESVTLNDCCCDLDVVNVVDAVLVCWIVLVTLKLIGSVICRVVLLVKVKLPDSFALAVADVEKD